MFNLRKCLNWGKFFQTTTSDFSMFVPSARRDREVWRAAVFALDNCGRGVIAICCACGQRHSTTIWQTATLGGRRSSGHLLAKDYMLDLLNCKIPQKLYKLPISRSNKNQIKSNRKSGEAL